MYVPSLFYLKYSHDGLIKYVNSKIRVTTANGGLIRYVNSKTRVTTANIFVFNIIIPLRKLIHSKYKLKSIDK